MVLGAKGLEQEVACFKAACDTSKSPAPGCFEVTPCVQTARYPVTDSDDERICLGRYGPDYERLLQRGEMTISRNAYSLGVLYELVLITLQAQANAVQSKP